MKARYLDHPNATKTSTDDINAWLDAAGRVSLMSQEELILAFKRLEKLEPNTPAYNRCKQKIVERNLRLIPNFVHRFMRCKSRYRWGSVETVDFLQAGAFGLIRAVEKYDYKTGYRFSTYAMHWIRSFVGRYNMYTMSQMYIPEDTHLLMHTFRKKGIKGINDNPKYSNRKSALDLIRNGLAASKCILFCEVSLLEGLNIEESIPYPSVAPVDCNEGQFSLVVEDAIACAGVTADEANCLRDVYIGGLSATTAAKRRKMCYKRFQKLHDQALKKLETTIDPGILEL